MPVGTHKRHTTTISSTSGRNTTNVNTQQRNDIEERPLTQSDIPLIVKQVVDSLSETDGRPFKTIDSIN